MKRILFSLTMMLALVVVAGSAWAANLNAKNVNGGGSYSYALSGVSVTAAASITVDYVPDGTTPVDATVSAITPASFTGAATDQTITFNVKYGTEAAPSTSGKIVVTITEAGCSNFIELGITVSTPSLTLAIATTDKGCQNTKASPLADNTDASVDAAINTITFTFNKSADPTGLASYTYTYAVSANASLGISASSASKTNATSETVSFSSKEGGATSVTATISSGSFTLDADNGGGTYPITITTSSASSAVKALPTIGSFLP